MRYSAKAAYHPKGKAMNWQYMQPVEIIFGCGKIDELCEICSHRGYEKGVLVCDPFFVQNGLSEKVVSASRNRITAIFSDVTANPRTSEADACATLMRETGADFAIALGGGSAMDCAKAACMLATDNLSASAYHTGGTPISGKSIPLIAVPTTAGTGSEVTGVAVLTDEKKGVKAPIGHPCLFPKIALIDPELTVSMPPFVTAVSGLDALSHALEGFWSRGHQPICDAIALEAARTIFEYLPRTFSDGTDLEAREKMCEASLMAGLSFALPKTAASHAISFPLTNVYGLPHGEACAFTLDSLCTINAEAENGRLNDFARKLGFENAAEMGGRISQMKREMGLRCTLTEAGIPFEALSELAKLSKHPNLDNNPVALDEQALISLFAGKADAK